MRSSGEQFSYVTNGPCKSLIALRQFLLLLVAITSFTFTVVACGSSKTTTPTAPTAPAPTPTPVATPPRSTENPAGSVANADARTSVIRADGSLPSAVFDDFTLTTATTIRTVGWQGIYCTEVANAPTQVPSATGFSISFHPADSGGGPNANTTLQQSAYPLAQVSQSLDRNGTGTCGTATPTAIGVYNYTVTLATPFNAAAGTRYWLSVQANVPSIPPFWGWRSGTADNGVSFQLFNGQFTTFSTDRAFTLRP